MEFIVWDATYEVGVKEVDTQHQKLVQMINDLDDAICIGQGSAALKGILGRLVDYTKYHFATEERLMTAHDYPGYLSHKREHDTFIQQVLEFQRKFQDGLVALTTISVMNFLKNWLVNHILKTDKIMGQYLSGKGVV